MCFSYFKCMFHVFYTDVAKVDQDAAYIAKVLHVCCMCFYFDVTYISHICCKYFIWMLRMFAMVFKCLSGVFTSISDASFKCFIVGIS
jgi:hypothetical protein